MIASTLVIAPVANAAEHGAGVDAGEALRMILEGNQRFVAGKLEHPNQTPARRTEIAKGQHPFASVLTCSDSRTAPEILLDRGLGDIFVVRVAGIDEWAWRKGMNYGTIIVDLYQPT